MNTNNLLKAFTLFILLLGSTGLLAQDIEVTDGATDPYTPENLVTNIFLGDGVEVVSITYTGGANAVGFFKNAEEEIGIDRGLVMTSGSAASVMGNIGIDNNGSVFASTGNGTGGGDADLQSLTTNNILDLCRYEITFIPTSDTVQFRYVFASEEYPEYACSPFNDVFGFFISGPGINGPYANNAENIAIIPGTNLPVTINNLHPQNGPGCPPVNDQFYNDNNGSNMQPVYDGFTDVFVAQAVVVPCQQYTIKLAISDAGDTAFDSGVFLEAKSFGAPALQVDLLTQSLDGTISEECSDATLCISLPSPAESDVPIDFTIFGTATNGVDYTTIPDTLVIPQGDSVICLDISAFEDGIAEGDEFIGFDIQRDVCNRDTFYINIRENELISPDLGPDLELCQTDTVQLDGTINIPLPDPPSFTNQNDVFINPPMTSVYSSINVFGVQPFELGPGVIQSVCVNIDHNWLSDLDLFLVAPSGLFMELSTDNGSNGDDLIETCFTPTATTPINYISPPATGAPYTGDFAVEGVWEDLWGAAEDLTNGQWNLLMIDDQNGFAGTLLDWTITFEPLYQIYYEWTPAAGLSCANCPDPLASPDTTTTYVLRAYDSYGCEVFDTITITVDEVLPAPVVTCGVVTNDCITFEWTAIPGATGYLVNVDNTFFQFSNGATSHTVCGLTFEQTVAIQVLGIDDCNGLIGTAECTTPACDGALPSVDAINDASCFGLADGSVQLSASGSFPPFTFSLGAETNDTGLFTGLPGGIYTVTITNSAPCGVTIDVVIPEPDSIIVNEVVMNDVECFDAADGSATVNVNGGVYPYTFAWSDGPADSLRTDLPAGLYTVIVTDANGCTGSTDVEITEPELLELDFDTDIVACFDGSDGTATVLPIGGVEPYSIQWDANANNQVTETAVDLPAGTYSVIVTDANNCTASASVDVTQNTEITLDFNTQGASCSGIEDGTATVIPSGGGIGFYTYNWDANTGFQLTPTAIDLDVGTYTVTVTDFLGCQVVDSIFVDAPNALVTEIMVEATTCSYLNDGVAMVTVTGGQPGYTYEWSDIGLGQPDRNDLPAGSYTVTVTDDNECFEVIDFSIGAATEIVLDLSATEVDCASSASGSATVIPTGGAGAYTYLWEDNQVDSIATGLNAGMISVTVTDANGCEAVGDIEVIEPEVIALTPGSTPALCFGTSTGTATVIADGGAGNYTYQWDDPNGQVTPTAVDLPAGSYMVTVTDLNNCSSTSLVVVDEPALLENTMGATNLSCSGSPDGTATANPEGGTAPYFYSWSNGQSGQTATSLPAGTAFVTITDFNGCEVISSVEVTAPEALEIALSPSDVSCNAGMDGSISVSILSGTAPYEYNWSSGDMTAAVNQLTAGLYTVTVTDANDCEAIESIVIDQPDALNAQLSQQGSTCFNGLDGSASVLSINYGNTPADLDDFSFAWNIPGADEATIDNLVGGQTYSVTITDPLGCVLVESIAIDNPAPVEAEIAAATDASCFDGGDGQATATAAGGVGSYTFQWDFAAGEQTTATATGLAAGSYNVTIADGNGCEAVTSVTIAEPADIDFSFETNNVECFGASTGAAVVDIEGGTAPYSVDWSNGNTGFTAGALAAGTYQISITDANGCEQVGSTEILQPEVPLTADYVTEDVSCYGGEDGRINLTTSGGTKPYRYSLDGENFVGSELLIALEPGFYQVIVEDANGCTFVTSDILINEPDPLTVNLGADIQMNFGEVITFMPEIQSTNPIVNYTWSATGPGELTCYDCPSPSTVDSFDVQTSFLLTIEDINGCTAQDRVNLIVRKERRVYVPTGFTPNNDGTNDRLIVHGEEGTYIKLFQVFDRWGEIVYQNGNFPINEEIAGWDGFFRGQAMNSGVYIWYLEVEYFDGEEEAFKGSTNLIR